MKLEQLSPENISTILGKKLCLFQASKKYIEEMEQKYGIEKYRNDYHKNCKK